MIFLILFVILLLWYMITLKVTVKSQDKTIQEQKDVIQEQKDAIMTQISVNKFNKERLDFYYNEYINISSGIDKTNQPTYDLDEILQEISAKGIKNIDKNKLDFLKKFGKK